MIDRRNVLLAAALTAGAADAATLPDPASGGLATSLRPDGRGDNGDALTKAGRSGPIVLPAGRYRVTRDTRIANGLLLEPGAVLLIEHATLVIDGFFEAARCLAFDCHAAGRVVFGAGAIVEGYPEWWGARPGDAAFDCLPALNACVGASAVTRLGACDYFVRDTFKIHVPYRQVRGTGWYGQENGTATRIVLAGPRAGTASVVQLGADTMPADVNAHDFGIGLFDLVLARTAPCVPPPGGEETRAACGLVARHLVQAQIERVAALEHSIGFYLHNLVFTKLTDCFSQRYQPGTSPEGDIMRGFFYDGRRKGQFTAGNASLYMDRCNVTGSHAAHVDAIAFKAAGAFGDLYVDRMETSNVPKGCVLEAERTPNTDSGNINCHIRNCIFDWCSGIGIEAHAGPPSLTTVFADIYVSLAPGALAGMAILDGGGLVSISDGEIHGDAAKGSLWIGNQSGVAVNGLKVRRTTRPVLLDRARGCDIQVGINNPETKGRQAAVLLTDSHRNFIRPTVIGGSGAFPAGVELLGQGNHHNEINCTAIDPAALTGGEAAAKLRLNGRPIGAQGEFGNGNLASGVMG